MSSTTAPADLTLNKQLVTAVIELIDFYSKKGVFKVPEYKDIANINERLETVLAALNEDSTYTDLTTQELGFIVLIFKEGSVRIPTSVDNFGQLYGIYQHFVALFEKSAAADKAAQEANSVPTVEELNAK